MSELTPQQKYIGAEYLAALEIYRASNPLVRDGSKNFTACVNLMEASGLSSEYFHRNAFLSALAQVAAAGNLDRERTPEENAERERRRNAELEARDRAPGNAATPRGHMSQDEQDRLEAEGNKNLQDNLKAIKEAIKAGTTPVEQEELSASDCLYALTGGDPKTPFTREKATLWLKKWPTNLTRSVFRRNENVKQRVEDVIRTGIDPMTGVENV